MHSFNRYAYANNNPYKYVDPDGEFVFTAIAIAAVAYSAYDGYQSGGTSGALAEASGYNDAVASYNDFKNGNYEGAVFAAGSIVFKPLKGAKAVAKGGSHFKGAEKAWADGATPNSTYTQIHPKMKDKAIQNSIYDADGKIVGQVDFKPQHGAPSGHGHKMTEPGNIGSGHQGAGTYVSPENLPQGWNTLPSGISPIKP